MYNIDYTSRNFPVRCKNVTQQCICMHLLRHACEYLCGGKVAIYKDYKREKKREYSGIYVYYAICRYISVWTCTVQKELVPFACVSPNICK